jgi:ElaB/YqjD/DUF883 family membrane-anchored ribosome-binding protein
MKHSAATPWRDEDMKTETSVAQTEAKLKQAASALANKAEQVTQTLGANVEAAAEVVRDRLPHEGRMGQASTVLSDQISAAGRYLQQKGLRDMMANMESVIRQYPVQSLLLGAGLGYLLSRLHRS